MKKNKLITAAQERGMKPDKMLIELFDQYGNMTAVARDLQMDKSTLSLSVMRCGLELKTVLVPRKNKF